MTRAGDSTEAELFASTCRWGNQGKQYMLGRFAPYLLDFELEEDEQASTSLSYEGLIEQFILRKKQPFTCLLNNE
jgi:hypothetical protein